MSHTPPFIGRARILLACAIIAIAFLSVAAVVAAPALDWTRQPGGQVAFITPSGTGRTGFTPMNAAATGVTFVNPLPPERHYTNQILLNGSGVAAGDVDGDGWCDVFFAGVGGRSMLYRNLGGWKFQDITADAGLAACAGLDATGVALADLDGDADLDLIVNSVGQGTHGFLNNGRGHFTTPPPHQILNRGHCGASLALADVDGNGTLDLYIANYRTATIRDQQNARFGMKTVNGRPVPESFGGRSLGSPDLTNRFVFHYRAAPGGGGSVFHDELGEPDLLLRNQGAGTFTAVPFVGGPFRDEHGRPLTQEPLDWGLSVMMRDFNGDGAPDIYVCNDFATPDRFWINDTRGGWRAAPASALRQTSLSTMAVDVADINRDGHDDFFTADMLSREHWRRLVQRNEANPNMHLFVDIARQPQSPRNALQLGRGDGTFAEMAQLAGLEAAEWAWASVFLDVDLDGFEDLLVANGFERDYMNMDANRRVRELQARGGPQMPLAEIQRLNRIYPRLDTANAAFRNLGNLRFAETSTEWGFAVRAVSQGMCLADLDNDGDLDVLINNSNAEASVLRNDSDAPRVAVRLKGRAPNTRGVGAKIRVLGGAVPRQSQEMIAGGRYLSSDDFMRTFAAGARTNVLTIEVTWRSGRRSLLTNVQANCLYEIDEAVATPDAKAGSRNPPPIQPLFRDVSSRIAHTHVQDPEDDFARQPQLPNQLSTRGPGVSWFDFDGDGWDDLILPGGRGRRLTVLRNDGRGAFQPQANVIADSESTQHATTVLAWSPANGPPVLTVGSRHDGTNEPVASQFAFGRNVQPGEALPNSTAATGPMALADLDGDGTLELFVGGRYLPGRWPEPAPSLVLRQADGRWVRDETNSSPLTNLGLVSGAVFTDLDADGDPDLALACEWGPVRVLRNDRGRLAAWNWNATAAAADPVLGANSKLLASLPHFTGWWNGITSGDFDGDGRLDLIASNWGRNTKYQRFRSQPLRVYYGDFNRDGGVGIVESWFDDALQRHVPILNVWTSSRSMPWLLERFPSFEAFSRAGVETALGERAQGAHYLAAAWLDTSVFLNRGDHFEVRPLPVEAQFAPAFAVAVADFDGDGHEDAFLGQNFFGVRAETSRYDAGQGLLLRGDGRGGFSATPGSQSGLALEGEQRGAAVADYDRDGRADLVVTQFGADTHLFRNQTAKPGLRVRLQGPRGNPAAVGAVVRLKSRDALGPAREIHAGSGYWSQDSSVQVLAGDTPPTGLWVRWPGGRIVEVVVPAGATEISVPTDGQVTPAR